MWVFLMKRVRLIVILSVVLPLARALVRGVANYLEKRAGEPTRSVRLLRTVDENTQKVADTLRGKA